MIKHGTFSNGVKKVLIVDDKNKEEAYYSDSIEHCVEHLISACEGKLNHILNETGSAYFKRINSFTAYCGDEKIEWLRK